MVDLPIRTSINTFGPGGGVVVSNDVVSQPPCRVWRVGSLSIDTQCLLNSLQLFAMPDFEPDGWPSMLPRPSGVSLEYLASVFDQTTTGKTRDTALEDIHKIDKAYRGESGGFRPSAVPNRVLSCRVPPSVPPSTSPDQAVYATVGVGSKLIQPSSVGCTFISQFCPLFAGDNSGRITWRFWTYHPNGSPPTCIDPSNGNRFNCYQDYDSKIRLDMWPGFTDLENQLSGSVTTYRKSMCNMDGDGRTCFYLKSSQLMDVAKSAGYGGQVVWPLNVRARWAIDETLSNNVQYPNVVSDWQTWLVINANSLPGSYLNNPALASCLKTPIG